MGTPHARERGAGPEAAASPRARRCPGTCAEAPTSRRLRLELLERDFLRRYTEKNLRTVNFFMPRSIAPRAA